MYFTTKTQLTHKYYTNTQILHTNIVYITIWECDISEGSIVILHTFEEKNYYVCMYVSM